MSEPLHHTILWRGKKKNHKVPININLCNPIEFSSWLGVRRIKILPKSVNLVNNMLERMSILEDCFTKEAQITLLSVACFVSLWISILGCVWISEHRKVIKLWDTPRRKVRALSPCFYTSDSLGTVAPWLIARDKTTHNKCQEGAPMGS